MDPEKGTIKYIVHMIYLHKFTPMRIGLIIADFEMSFTTSFKHTSRVKYGVDFTNSNIGSIEEKIIELKQRLQDGKFCSVHVGYDFTLHDVEHVQNLLRDIVLKYTTLTGRVTFTNKKIYTLIQQLRSVENKTPNEIAKEVLREILIPPTPAILPLKDRLKADAKQKSIERALKIIKKNSA